MEGDGDLMKMLMQADPPDENIQGAMEDPGMVQSGGYAQASMAFHSGHYGGMQQQLNPMGAQQQQQRGSSYHSMGTGQMMAQDMDMVLQQQQYQQPQQQSAYGNGNFQGYNGGYQGPSPVSPQTHNQPMVPYQGGFPSEHGYSQGAGANQAMGEYGPQAGPNQNMGITGPASLSLANLSAMSGRQQYYPDGYGMNQPVSPVRKQMQQGGGFLQPSRVPYPQQAQSYPSGSYPKRPSSSPVQNQMQGFPSTGSFTPRPNPGMQMPSISYQSPTSQYQPPHSPVMQSATSPIPQQDAGLYSRPREPFPQPRSPFGPSQGQLQQQSPHPHSSCMFVQPGTMPPQSQYQPQQQMPGAKSAALAQRRASYPGQQSPMKMPSSPLKRSPTSPLPNSKSPDLTRGSQGGFDERASFKYASKKEKASSPPSADLAQVAVSSKMKEAVPKNAGEGHKGLSRTRRSASDVGSPSVSPPVIKKDGADGVVAPKDAAVRGNIQELIKKHDNVDMKEEEPKKSDAIIPGEISKRSPKGQDRDKDKSPQGSSDNKADRPCSPMTADLATVVERAEPEKVTHLRKQTPTKNQQMVAATEEGCKEDEDSSNDGKKPASKIESSIAMSRETKNATSASVELDQTDGLPGSGNSTPDLRSRKDKELSGTESVNGKEPELTDKTEQVKANNQLENTCPEKSDERGSKTIDGTEEPLVESDKVKEPLPEAGKTVDGANISSQDTRSGIWKTGELTDGTSVECVVTDKGDKQPGKASQRAQSGQSDSAVVKTDLGMAEKALDSVSNGSKENEKNKDDDNDDDTDKVQTEAEKSDGQSKELSELDRTAEPSSSNLGASRPESNVESKNVPVKVAGDKIESKTSDSDSAQTAKVQKKPASVSLRCEERLSSDDDDRPAVPVESSLAPIAVSRTQGIQTSEETTASPRSSQQQATSIKATIIAKGKSPQNNQQVMVAKTTTGQMYLIQGNILVPVQSLNTKGGSASKQNSKVIIVNPVKTTTGSVGGSKKPVAAAKSSDSKEKRNEINTSNNTDKEKHSEGSKLVAGNKKSIESVSDSFTSPNNKSSTESTDKAPASTGSVIQPSQSVQTSALEKKKTTSKTECSTEKDVRNSPDKQPKTPSPNKNTTTTEGSPTSMTKYTGRGRPPGSKDKQKRKPFVHKLKRKQDDMDVGPNTEELAAKRKFSKTASVVKEMSSSLVDRSAASKRPLVSDVPTVNASKSPKRRKVSISSSPVKHISTKPRGGVDGDSWVCSLCGKRSGYNLLGDLYGPYKTRLAKEKTDNSSTKDGKPSQKSSSPGRVSSSTSDTPADRTSISSCDTREDMETCDLDLWIHRGCGVWSPGVFMLGRTIQGLEQAVESATQHNCTKCFEVGATLACFKRGCNRMFHFACARDSGCSFIEDNFTIFCSTHKC